MLLIIFYDDLDKNIEKIELYTNEFEKKDDEINI